MSEIQTSWKDTFIAVHGEEAYTKRLKQRREWVRKLPGGEKQRSQDRRDADPEKARENGRAWSRKNPQKIIEKGRKVSRKGGKYYDKKEYTNRLVSLVNVKELEGAMDIIGDHINV